MVFYQDEANKVEQEIFSGSLAEAKEALKALDEVMRTLPQTEAYKEANKLVAALESGNLESW